MSSVPGKTFLVGEYLALDGGPSILLTTEPRFYLEAGGGSRTMGFAPASPAGKFLARHPELRSGFEFRDPHRGKGGLGASSAQFALLYVAAHGLRALNPETFDWKVLLEEYRACAWNGEGQPPSGADVVGQLTGGVTWFDGREYRAQRLEWSFPRLGFTLFRTGTKLATHEHLKRPQAAPHEALRSAVLRATNAFETRNEDDLLASVRSTRQALGLARLTATGTLALLEKLDKCPWALAAKGCGAMGADVVLVLHDRAHEAEATKWAATEGLETCGRLKDLGAGFQFEER